MASKTLKGEQQIITVPAQIRLQDDGEVVFEDTDGNPLSNHLMKSLKEQHEDDVRLWLTARIEEMNADFDKCLNLHHGTPPVGHSKWLDIKLFDEPAPVAAITRPVKWWHKILMQRGKIERANALIANKHQYDSETWEKRRADNVREVEMRYSLYEGACRGDQPSMQTILQHAIESIEWPRETIVGFEIQDDGYVVALDVDLPEVENMPRQLASAAARGFRVLLKKRSDAQIRADYSQLVHAIAFRVVGEVFAALPGVHVVTASGYTQRSSSVTGKTEDVYVLSARVRRTAWSQIDFASLSKVNPIEALDAFELLTKRDRRNFLERIDPL